MESYSVSSLDDLLIIITDYRLESGFPGVFLGIVTNAKFVEDGVSAPEGVD